MFPFGKDNPVQGILENFIVPTVFLLLLGIKKAIKWVIK